MHSKMQQKGIHLSIINIVYRYALNRFARNRSGFFFLHLLTGNIKIVFSFVFTDHQIYKSIKIAL